MTTSNAVRTGRDARPAAPARHAYADNLKALLVAGVVVAHVLMAWTGAETWVFDEPPVREPLLTMLRSLELVGAFFGMALFFLVAGYFTPRSLERKGTRRFLTDRVVRLGGPLLAYTLLISPVVEWADPDTRGWDRGFLPAFVLHTWRDVVPGPTWFLAVLLVFTFGYVAWRAVRPRPARVSPLRARHLVVAGLAIAAGSYAVRLVLPLGDEYLHVAFGQAPAWLAGFVLGVLGAERGWFDPLPARLVPGLRRAAWAGALAGPAVVAVFGGSDADLDAFAGGGTWQSALAAVVEAVVAVAMSLWLLDVFRRRADSQGRLARAASRAAYPAFVVHQLVLVWLVLLSHGVGWAPEAKVLAVAVLGVAGSFGLGALLARVRWRRC